MKKINQRYVWKFYTRVLILPAAYISLTNKIRSLGSLPERSPVVLKDNKYYGDITHRYFQEEIVAIKFVLRLSEQYGVDMKYMKKIYECFISL